MREILIQGDFFIDSSASAVKAQFQNNPLSQYSDLLLKYQYQNIHYHLNLQTRRISTFFTPFSMLKNISHFSADPVSRTGLQVCLKLKLCSLPPFSYFSSGVNITSVFPPSRVQNSILYPERLRMLNKGFRHLLQPRKKQL